MDSCSVSVWHRVAGALCVEICIFKSGRSIKAQSSSRTHRWKGGSLQPEVVAYTSREVAQGDTCQHPLYTRINSTKFGYPYILSTSSVSYKCGYQIAHNDSLNALFAFVQLLKMYSFVQSHGHCAANRRNAVRKLKFKFSDFPMEGLYSFALNTTIASFEAIRASEAHAAIRQLGASRLSFSFERNACRRAQQAVLVHTAERTHRRH